MNIVRDEFDTVCYDSKNAKSNIRALQKPVHQELQNEPQLHVPAWLPQNQYDTFEPYLP